MLYLQIKRRKRINFFFVFKICPSSSLQLLIPSFYDNLNLFIFYFLREQQLYIDLCHNIIMDIHLYEGEILP